MINVHCIPEEIIEEFPDPPPEPTPEEIMEILFPEARITNKEIISARKIVRNGLLQRCNQDTKYFRQFPSL